MSEQPKEWEKNNVVKTTYSLPSTPNSTHTHFHENSIGRSASKHNFVDNATNFNMVESKILFLLSNPTTFKVTTIGNQDRQNEKVQESNTFATKLNLS